ncbi:hypothetical protein LPTSP4_13810 [Leptospira ryugenii]|uniref:DNA alkylation repair enzyme n=1 Tax=Leptospira ryugenii TaxID=1917863 RepID=A0A2P2DZ08_9LEPT|nr:DNA alkylation repair protein [Leptospira ryugenii]GBF49861.1 hypothetical protein LPTSP4_13810 [Leptospira ryugenii]
MTTLAKEVLKSLKKKANPEKAKFYPKFFKTEKGEYGYGDKFLGVVVPEQRNIAKQYYKQIQKEDIQFLLDEPFHEARLTALFLLVLCYQKRAKTVEEREAWVRVYIEKMDRVNNWDLVDSSADKILGHYYFQADRSYIHSLVNSKDLWETRIAVMTSFYWIRMGDFSDTLHMCKILLKHPHDLIHKATGWMLREIGNRHKASLNQFLSEHHKEMPRTMLRYAIDRLPDTERKHWLNL